MIPGAPPSLGSCLITLPPLHVCALPHLPPRSGLWTLWFGQAVVNLQLQYTTAHRTPQGGVGATGAGGSSSQQAQAQQGPWQSVPGVESDASLDLSPHFRTAEGEAPGGEAGREVALVWRSKRGDLTMKVGGVGGLVVGGWGVWTLLPAGGHPTCSGWVGGSVGGGTGAQGWAQGNKG